MRHILKIVALVLLPAAAAGQSVVLKGTVRTPEGLPASSVRVSLLHPSGSATTDSMGAFRFSLSVATDRGQVLLLMAGDQRLGTIPCRLGVVAGDSLAVDLSLEPRETLPARDRGLSNLPSCQATWLRRAHRGQIDTLRARSTFDPIASAARLPALREASRRPGYRELRVSAGGGMLWEPTTMLRIVDDNGRVTGAEYLWYSAKAREHWDNPRFFSAEHVAALGCRTARRVHGAALCKRSLADRADMKALAAGLDSLGVWTLPSQSALGMYFNHATDQAEVTVELLDGLHYGAFFYYDPGGEPHGDRVVEMLRLMRASRPRYR